MYIEDELVIVFFIIRFVRYVGWFGDGVIFVCVEGVFFVCFCVKFDDWIEVRLVCFKGGCYVINVDDFGFVFGYMFVVNGKVKDFIY